MECLIDEFLQLFTKIYLNLAIGWTGGNSPSNPCSSGICLKFLNFLWNVLELIFFNFIPKEDKIWPEGGRLGTRHQIEVFQEFA